MTDPMTHSAENDACPARTESGTPCQKRGPHAGHWFMSDDQWACLNADHFDPMNVLSMTPLVHLDVPCPRRAPFRPQRRHPMPDAENAAPACECPTDDYCPKCHPRWYAIWRAKQEGRPIDEARIVGRDLSPAAADLALREGWAAHARMHPATAAEYEARVLPPAGLANACTECGDCFHPVVGPNTDGEPCEWCRDCGCHSDKHARMTRPIPPAIEENS